MATINIPIEELKRGSTGNSVKLLQRLLNAVVRGLAPELSLDGIFGAKTENYVDIAQGFYKLEQTGIVNAKLWEALLGFEF